MRDHVDSRSSIAVVLLTLIVLIYAILGPGGRDQLLLSIAVLTVVLVCARLVPRGTGGSKTVIQYRDGGPWQPAPRPAAVGGVTRHVGAVDRAGQAVEAAQRAVDLVEHEALGASVPDPPRLDTPFEAPAPPAPQVAGEVVQLPPAVPVLSPEDEIARSLELTLRRGVCPQFIPGPAPPNEVYEALIHSSTQASLNQALVDIVSTRVPNETENYYRRERLATALAEDLITYNRNEGGRLKDTHLQQVTAAYAARGIAQSLPVAGAAETEAARADHIGVV